MSDSPTVALPPGFDVDDDTPVFVISVAAQLSGMHPQTLRQYDRLGLVSPGRSSGRGRRYSARDVALLLQVQRLSQEEGVNLAGVKRVLELEDHVDALRARLAEVEAELAAARTAVAQTEARVHAAYRRDLVPVRQHDGSRLAAAPHPGRVVDQHEAADSARRTSSSSARRSPARRRCTPTWRSIRTSSCRRPKRPVTSRPTSAYAPRGARADDRYLSLFAPGASCRCAASRRRRTCSTRQPRTGSTSSILTRGS